MKYLRPTKLSEAGETLYQCGKCTAWKVRVMFPSLHNPASVCKISSWCRRCDNAANAFRKREKRRLARENAQRPRVADEIAVQGEAVLA